MKKTYLKTSLIAAVASLAVISNDAPAQRRPQPNEQINQEEIVIPTMTPRRSERQNQQKHNKHSEAITATLNTTPYRHEHDQAPRQVHIKPNTPNIRAKPQVQQPQQQPRSNHEAQPQRPQPQRQPQRRNRKGATARLQPQSLTQPQRLQPQSRNRKDRTAKTGLQRPRRKDRDRNNRLNQRDPLRNRHGYSSQIS